MLKNSNSMQYLPIFRPSDELNIYHQYSKFSNQSSNNYNSSNLSYPKHIIHKKNSATLLTAHNIQYSNLQPLNIPSSSNNKDNNISYLTIYQNENQQVPSINKNNQITIEPYLKRYYSSENLNILNLPSIGPVVEQKNNIPIFISKPSYAENNSNNNINNNKKIISKMKKNQIPKIPHPQFSKKKLLKRNIINKCSTKYNYNNDNYYTQIFPNPSITNNNCHSALNDSITSFVHNYLNSSLNSEKSLNSNSLNQILFEEEPGENFNLSEFTVLNQIGNGAEGTISIVNWIKNNKNYALKKCEIIFDDVAEKRKREFKTIKDFIDTTGFDGIIKTYGILCLENQFGTYYFYELMELAEKDWEKEILERQKNNLYYQEYELMDIFTKLIKTLSSLQKISYTHRDIKPQNIMLVNGNLKLCDFGNGRLLKREGIIIQKIRGSELFMSPIVFKGYHAGMQNIKHNTYKSDVYSLGMCFFFAASLNYGGLNIIREIYDMNIVKKVLNQFLGKRYSQNLINLLLTMLQVEESKRPDFNQLEILLAYN